jgi:hypothetical protein
MLKAKPIAGQWTKQQLRDSFVHTIKELQGSDSRLQALIDLNGPLHSNWVGLLEPVSQPITNKQLI